MPWLLMPRVPVDREMAHPLLRLLFSITGLMLFASMGICAEEEAAPSIEYSVELDPYYTNAGLHLPLTLQAIPDLGEADEVEIYRRLFLHSFTPRFLVLEASVNPLPLTGVYIHQHQPGIYDNSMLGGVNLVESVTAGFEEPAALSLFLGNVVSYRSEDAIEGRSNKGYMGYLLSVGSKHIKDNQLVDDNWLELEWKLKSDQYFRTRRLGMSYRIGTKLHGNDDISDVVYLGLRRNHLQKQQTSRLFDLLNNSDLEYTLTLENGSYELVQQELRIGKKWPLSHWAEAFSIDIGLIWYTNRKYQGALAETQDRTTFILRPNIEF